MAYNLVQGIEAICLAVIDGFTAPSPLFRAEEHKRHSHDEITSERDLWLKLGRLRNSGQQDLFTISIEQSTSNIIDSESLLQPIVLILVTIIREEYDLSQPASLTFVLDLITAVKLNDRIISNLGINGDLKSSITSNQGLSNAIS
ncbi:hypothetical protein D3C73_1100420 [compost metagenome]